MKKGNGCKSIVKKLTIPGHTDQGIKTREKGERQATV